MKKKLIDILRFPLRHPLTMMIVLILIVRFVPHWGEGYARYVYPWLSACMSWIASAVPFSLTEWIVIAAIVSMIAYPFFAIRHRKTKKHICLVEVKVVLWMMVWFYVGWGMNYYRDTFFQRAGVNKTAVNKAEFQAFLKEYTDSLNASYCIMTGLSHDDIEREVKECYSVVKEKFGLCSPKVYQHPKTVSFNWLYSSVGVLGYMGPFADESHLNSQLFPVQYPFTYAHELAHLLSVSSEAEANFWAYQACTHSHSKGIRYSGYFGLLPNVYRNALTILSDKEMDSWCQSVDKRIWTQRKRLQGFWRSQYNPLLSDIQDALFNALLKSNRISDGKRDYDQVIQMIMTKRHHHGLSVF